MIPTKIGRYEVKSELGRGGMAVVYRAYDPSFDREVAIKVLPKEFLHDPNFLERFKREIKIIAGLEHPSIVPVYDLGEEDGSPYFVMRYMPGGSLTSRINQGNFSLIDAAKVIEKVAAGISYAHQKEIVHRDLKPDNILFDANGDPYISDFGVASFSANSEMTGTAAIGTPAYMSPEQAQGDKVDSRSDIYGLGVIIFQMLSGHQPYKADTPMGVALKQITDPVPEILKSNPELPIEADTIIKTAMAKNKDDRYASATDLANAVGQAAKSGKTGEMQRLQASTSSNNKRNLIIVAGGAFVGGVILLAIVAALILFLFPTTKESTPTATIAPASASTEAPVPTIDAKFFTEDFNSELNENWKYFVTGGDENLVSASVQDGFMNFNVSKKELSYYAYYAATTYDNVRIDVKAENRGDANSIVVIMCRYTEGKNWYEFEIDSGGLYKIMYVSLNNDKINTSPSMIANGGSNLINVGKQTNEYSATCNDRTLSLSVNGEEIKSVVDNKFILTSGSVGIGVASGKAPAEARIDSLSINEP